MDMDAVANCGAIMRKDDGIGFICLIKQIEPTEEKKLSPSFNITI